MKNNENCIIRLESVNCDQNGENKLKFFTKGNYSYKNGKAVFNYIESELTGYNGCQMCITAEKDVQVTIKRSGEMSTWLTIDRRKPCVCVYGTPMGAFEIVAEAVEIKNNLDENGGELILKYRLLAEGDVISSTDMNIKIKLK